MGGKGWPPWARRLATAGLAVHIAAILAGAWAAPPASDLEGAIAQGFKPYHDLIDQGYSYRYYAPAPPPTPIVWATLKDARGGTLGTVRIPERGLRPRLRYQRQLALANHLYNDVEQARHMAGDPIHSYWARSFARHLGKEHPGCKTVELAVQWHQIPPVEAVRAQRARPGSKGADLDAEQFFSAPERIGEFPCDAS